MSLSSSTQKRLLADLKRIQEEPIPLANARPRGDQNLTLWDAVVGVELNVSNLGLVTAPLHFLIDFPTDYPHSAPSIGFSFNFPYRDGASYTESKGRLAGKLVICLDVLGNFANVHTEWKGNRGTGWSPAYTVTTLLVQLQSVLCDIGKGMSAQEQEDLYCTALRFAEKNPNWIPELLTEEDLVALKQERKQAASLRQICGEDELLRQRIETFSRKARFANDFDMMDTFLQIINDASSRSRSGSEDTNSSGTRANSYATSVDTNICCFSTGVLYTDALLGVGIYRKGKNLGTAGELLSHEAYKGGLRQSTDKSPFEFFLPVWINQKHAASNPKWSRVLRDSYLEIGKKVYNAEGDDAAILEVFPRLINQLIVEMMRPDQEKTEAIATFEALSNCWRTLRWLLDTRPSLCNRIRDTLTKFVADEKARHKDVSPDLGVVLVLFTVLQGCESCPAREAFVDAYADENFVRCVMWCQDTVAPKAAPVLEATKVSREICMFQLMLSAIVVGDDVNKTLQEIEETNCKVPERLELLQSRWREQKASTNTWKLFF
jgi:ubiquitin-protein ligase